MKEWPILYKYTQKGQIQHWQIFTEDNSYWTEEGIQGGVLTRSKPTFCKGKNTGKKNATTDEEQAILEAQAKWQKKKDSHYNEILQEERSFYEPMLAHSFDDYGSKIDWSKDRVFVQPKLDGLRAVNDGTSIMSRNGKPYLAVPHLLHNQEGVILDGELYNHHLKEDFNKIVSLCKKQKPTDDELSDSRRFIQYWVYDLPSVEGDFSFRYGKLLGAKDAGLLPTGVVVVPTFEVNSLDEIKDYHAQFIGQGYEGTMVRINAPYENKRSKNLLKFKDFIDEEFTIVGYEEGTGGRVGTIGYFIMQHDKIADQTFKSNVKGNHDYLRKVWDERDSYIGKSATVKYFQRTPKKEDGGDVPRFPFIIKINREEYE